MSTFPRTVGRFELVREIGRGGMAVVYLARQSDLDREVAVKELPAFHAADPTLIERFLRESRIAGGLNHPNIATVYDYFEHEGVPYIAMEYLPRGSLRPAMTSLKLEQALGVLEGLLSALAYGAARSVVHRDLKPENLLLTDDGGVKVTDFGIAKALDSSTAQFATSAGTTVGTPAYMAPEQALGRPVDARTDLYSAGVIAYEMLAGRIPFEQTDTPLAMMLKHVNEAPPPASTVNPDLDPRLAAWIEAMMAKAPEDRPQSAASAWDALEEIALDKLGPRWRRHARVLPVGQSPTGMESLTPAPFPSEAASAAAQMTPTPPGDSDFRTYQAPAAPVPTPAASGDAPPPPPSKGPTPRRVRAPKPPAPAPGDTLPPTTHETEFEFRSLAEERAKQAVKRRRAWLIAAGVAVLAGGVGGAIALSGGGGGGDTQPAASLTLTRQQYREQGNQICGETQAGLDTILAGIGAGSTPQQVRDAIELYLNSTVARRLSGLAALAPPSDLAADHSHLITNQRAQEELFRGLVADLDAGQPLGPTVTATVDKARPLSVRADVFLRRLGLTQCLST